MEAPAPQFQTKCSNFTEKQFLRLAIAREATAAACFFACLLTLVLIIFFRLFNSVLQRLFLYLTCSTLFYLIVLILEGEHIFYYPYHGQKQVCEAVGFLAQWAASMEVLFTFGITLFLNIKVVQEQARGESLPHLAKKWRWILECSFLLICAFLPLTVDWLPFDHHTYGLAGAWCWIMSVDVNCTDIGTRDQMLYFGPLIVLTTLNIVLTLIICLILCNAARRFQETRHYHRMRAREILLLLVFLVTYAVLSNTGIVPHFLAGLINKRTFYGLWVADAIGTPLGKLVIPVAFLLYLYSLKKFKWSAIKATAREWACKNKNSIGRVRHFAEATEGPPTIHSSQVTSGYSSTHFSPSHSFLCSSVDDERQPLLANIPPVVQS